MTAIYKSTPSLRDCDSMRSTMEEKLIFLCSLAILIMGRVKPGLYMVYAIFSALSGSMFIHWAHVTLFGSSITGKAQRCIRFWSNINALSFFRVLGDVWNLPFVWWSFINTPVLLTFLLIITPDDMIIRNIHFIQKNKLSQWTIVGSVL